MTRHVFRCFQKVYKRYIQKVYNTIFIFLCDARIPSRCGFVGAFFASKLLGFDTAAPGLGRLTTWQRPVDFRKVARSTGYSAWAADGWWMQQVPSWQRAHIPYQGTFEDDFPCHRWDMLVPWRVSHLHGLQLVFEPCHGVFAGANGRFGGYISLCLAHRIHGTWFKLWNLNPLEPLIYCMLARWPLTFSHQLKVTIRFS